MGAAQNPKDIGRSLLRLREHQTPGALPRRLEIEKTGIFDEIERQLLIVDRAAAALIDGQAGRAATTSDAKLRNEETVVLSQNSLPASYRRYSRQKIRLVVVTGALLALLGLEWFCSTNLNRYFNRDDLTGIAAVKSAAERIITVESNNDPNAKNSRSSATGLGQFLNQTWLDLIRTYRPDLAKGRSESEILELRRDPKLAREITLRSVEQSAALLRRRGLPVNLGTIYLMHFAGSAGAAAILSAAENADAALVIASADPTGRTKRTQIVSANPFLERFTVADLKAWADRKMRDPRSNMTRRPAAGEKQSAKKN